MTSRTRSRSTLPYEEEIMEVSGTSTGTYGPYETQDGTETMIDVVTPGYQSKIARGIVINNPCSYEKVELESLGSGYGHYVSGSHDYEINGPLTRFRVGNSHLSHPLDALDCSAEQAKFYALSNVDRTPYAFGEDLLEIGETIRFIRNPLGSLRNLSRSFRSDVNSAVSKQLKKKHVSRYDYVRKRADAVADTWLQYRFAVSPLVRSVQDAMSALKHDEPRPTRASARGFSEDSSSASGEIEDAGSTTRTYDVSTSQHVVYRASILYEIDNPVDDWRYRLGLRNRDIPETIWAVLPFSFMVDRLVNVSASIRGLTALANPHLKILAASVTTRNEYKTSYRHTGQFTAGWTNTVSGETRKYTRFTYDRSLWDPTVSDAIPSVTPKNLVKDVTSTVDLIALILQNFK